MLNLVNDNQISNENAVLKNVNKQINNLFHDFNLKEFSIYRQYFNKSIFNL